MYCRKCGANNDDSTSFCVECGDPIQPIATVSRPVPTGSVPNFMTQSILTTLCCCLPRGIVAIIYSAQVNTKLQLGDYEGALTSSKNADMWGKISFGIGALLIIIRLLAMFFNQ